MLLDKQKKTNECSERESEVSNSRGKKTHLPLPLSSLHEFFVYDPTSPSGLRWKKLAHTRAKGKVGEVAGCLRGEVWGVSLKGQRFKCHRVVFALHYGDPGVLEIDHIDRNSTNNNIENLRMATRSQNAQNRDKQNGKNKRPCSSSYKGVSFHRGKWRLNLCGKELWFEDEVEAANAYNTIATAHYGEFAALNTIQETK